MDAGMAKKTSANRAESDKQHLLIYAIAILAAATIAVLLHSLPSHASGQDILSGEQIVNLELTYVNGTSVFVNVYLAATPEEQQAGLMNISSMGDCNGMGDCYGMLFVFPSYSNQCFWMKDTIMPLRQFWIMNGAITAEENGIPYSTSIYCHNGDKVLETYLNSTLQIGNRAASERNTS